VDNATLEALAPLPLRELRLDNLPSVVGNDCVATAITIHTQLRELTLAHIPEFYDESLECISTMESLEVLYCDCDDVQNSGFRAVAGMAGLRALSVRTQDSLTNEHVAPLSGHTSLTELALKAASALATIAAPASITTLRVLNISYCRGLTDEAFLPLKDHPNLSTVVASYCSDVQAVACEVFASMPRLQELHLEGCHKLTDTHLTHFWAHGALRVINLNRTQLDGSGLTFLSAIESLEEIMLESCYKVSIISFEIFRNHPSLSKISFANTPIDGALLAPLADALKLKILNVNGNRRVRDQHLSWFRIHPFLEEVFVNSTSIDGSCLKELATIKTLRVLSMNDNFHLVPGALNALTKHPSLANISLIGCRLLSGNEVRALLSCPNFTRATSSTEHADYLVRRYPRRLVLL
jgi:hypothetical protein